ncbi:hypothetical protein FRB95_012820 [Tulasnella sp. JGI-2019a]|nr:hypothetical protein FRB95_012820 [Tulasnella sp. JGI-2019a]
MSEPDESPPPRRSGSLSRIGSDSSGSLDNLTIILKFSENSVFNSIISSPDNDIMYEVSTPNKLFNRVSTTFRLDPTRGERTLSGEVEWASVPIRTRVRIGFQTLEWMLVNDWLENLGGWTSASRAFVGANGARYRWKRKFREFHLTADEDSSSKPPTFAIFREPKRNALLKVTEMPTIRVSPEALPSLDHIIVSLLVMEKRHRDK